MRNGVLFSTLVFFAWLAMPIDLHAAVVPISKSKAEIKSVLELDANDLISLQRKDLEEKIGRKLTFKEKLALPFVKKKLKKNTGLSGRQALEQAKTDGFAIAGFVTGLVSLFLFGFILGVVGIVFSAIALGRIKREPETRTGKGFAIAGLILGIVGVIGWAIILLVGFA